MHVCDQQIGAPIVVIVEELQPHASPGSPWKILRGLVCEHPAAHVLEIVVAALHIENVEVREAVFVQICDGRIAAPARIAQPNVL